MKLYTADDIVNRAAWAGYTVEFDDNRALLIDPAKTGGDPDLNYGYVADWVTIATDIDGVAHYDIDGSKLDRREPAACSAGLHNYDTLVAAFGAPVFPADIERAERFDWR